MVFSSIKKIKGNPFVMVGKKEGAHLVNLRKPWLLIRSSAAVRLLQSDELVGPLIEQQRKNKGRAPSYDQLSGL